jgi:hypothetical protein
VSTIEAISPHGQLSGEPHRPNNTNHGILLYKHITGEVENPVDLAPRRAFIFRMRREEEKAV